MTKFNEAELQHMRGLLQRKLEEGFAASPYASVVLEYETQPLPKTGVLGIPANPLGDDVLATDQSPVMLELLTARAHQEGLTIETRVMDGHALHQVAAGVRHPCQAGVHAAALAWWSWRAGGSRLISVALSELVRAMVEWSAPADGMDRLVSDAGLRTACTTASRP